MAAFTGKSETLTSTYIFTVTDTIRAWCTSVLHVHALIDNSIVVCGKENWNWKLARYSTAGGKEVGSVVLERKPDGLALVKLNGFLCVALSYT